MTDDNRPHPDPDGDPTTVTRWPPFGQPGENAPTADETQTQWVAADHQPTESPAQADEPPDPGGWFTPSTPSTPSSPPEEPQWADWDQPWQPTDEPFDQAAQTATDTEDRPEPTATATPEPAASAEPPGRPEPRTPSEYVSPYPEAATDRTGEPGRQEQSQPRPDQPSGGVAARTASLTNLHYLRVMAQVACPILLFVGLTFSEDNVQQGWAAYTAWAVFAMVCAVLQLAPLVGRSLGLTAENAWFLAAVGTAGLVSYWVIIVLPGVSSNTGFAQTLAAGLAVIGLWLSPGRRV